jgi:cell division protein FtsZ
LLEDISIEGATGIILNINGGSNLKIHEVNEATTRIMEAAHEDAEIIFGTVIDESIKDAVKVTVIATGLGGSAPTQSVFPSAEIPLPEASRSAHQAEVPPPPTHRPTPPPAPPSMGSSVHSQPQMASHVAPPPPPVHSNPVTMTSGAAPSKSHSTPMAEMSSALSADLDDVLLKDAPHSKDSAMMNGMSSSTMGTGAEGGELARARAIAQRLGITNLTDDEYDIPTYMRRQQEREV